MKRTESVWNFHQKWRKFKRLPLMRPYFGVARVRTWIHSRCCFVSGVDLTAALLGAVLTVLSPIQPITGDDNAYTPAYNRNRSPICVGFSPSCRRKESTVVFITLHWVYFLWFFRMIFYPTIKQQTAYWGGLVECQLVPQWRTYCCRLCNICRTGRLHRHHVQPSVSPSQ